MLEDSWESLDGKEIKPDNLKGNQTWIFLEGLMLKLKLNAWHLMPQRGWLIEKRTLIPEIGGQEGGGATKDEDDFIVRCPESSMDCEFETQSWVMNKEA